MFYLWIAMITFISTAGGVFLGIVIHNCRLSRNQIKKDGQKQQEHELIKRQAFIEAYFELKENFEVLNKMLKLIEENEEYEIGKYLDEITMEKGSSLGKNLKLNKLDFLIMDKLHTVVISKNKIEFYKKLYDDKIINHLELRASLADIIEDTKATMKFVESNCKEVFQDTFPEAEKIEDDRRFIRLPHSDWYLSF